MKNPRTHYSGPGFSLATAKEFSRSTLNQSSDVVNDKAFVNLLSCESSLPTCGVNILRLSIPRPPETPLSYLQNVGASEQLFVVGLVVPSARPAALGAARQQLRNCFRTTQ